MVDTLDCESPSTLMDRPVLTVTVASGPDKGKTVRFDQARVSLGRDVRNDFILSDSFVSSSHGEFYRSDNGFVYQDLGSLHGTILLVGEGKSGVEKNKVDKVPFHRDGTMRVGASDLVVKVDRVYRSERESGASRIMLTKDDGNELMAAQDPAVALAKNMADKGPRLDILFDLASKLNGISHLDQILDLIANAAFEAFPTASLFSISLVKGEDLRPVLVRLRGMEKNRAAEVLMSQSMLNRVVETKEAVLYVGGEQSIAPSASMIEAAISACMCAPLVGQRALLGVMQVDTRESGGRFRRGDLDLFCVLASHVAFALERANLVEDMYRMFEGFVQASVSAIEARDPSTAGHSERVAKYSLALAETTNGVEVNALKDLYFGPQELTELRYAALLHDFGKVGVRESVLNKATRLNEDKMKIIFQRFQLIQNAFRQKLLEEALRNSIKENQPVDGDALRFIEEKTASFIRGLRGEFRFLEQVCKKWRLEKKDIKRIQSFAQQRFVTLDGTELAFLNGEEVENLTIASGTLTEKEWEDMRSHVSQSEAYLRQIPWSGDLAQIPCIAGNHHEKLDGSGYPKGLLAAEITPRVRILTIADIFDAATAWDRPYSIPLATDRAAQLLKSKADDGQLDKDLVDLFITICLPKVAHLVPRQ